MSARLSSAGVLAPELSDEARRIVVGGQVQGVGFRPYVHRHARSHRLNGWVRNRSGRVEIHVQGEPRQLDRFVATLVGQAPPLARPVLEGVDAVPCCDTDAFTIRESRTDAVADVRLPPDLFTCDDCLRELNDRADRRYRYPFINCTQCGPRYSLIQALPYDRGNTSMTAFPLCDDCAAEYIDPANRRFHAEPVACSACGPALTFVEDGADAVDGNEPALRAALAALASGKLLAIKGIGGYHLACDAADDEAVGRLRARKPRPHKPLAVMFPAPAGKPLEVVSRFLCPDAEEGALLASPARPVVLVRQKPGSRLSAAIAPGLAEIGAMLPYSPLHHLLLNDYGAPLVMTSANISGEPVLTDNAEVESRLAQVFDACLHHDRSIVHAVDDSVFRVLAGRPRPLRLGRGVAPFEIDLPFDVGTPVLAVGAHMKNTIALAWGRRAVISPHIGEMGSLRGLQRLEQCAGSLQALYQVKAESIVCDAHPTYTTTRWALRQGLPVQRVYHHHAHAAAAWLGDPEDFRNDAMLVFAWDGVGLGPDGMLWGGEALLGRPGDWRRVGTMRPFRLPGGERAGREPWRSAAGLCWEAGLECPLGEASDPLLRRFWREGWNAPPTSAVGRLFDAASVLCGLGTHATFEGQGPMQLEALAAGCPDGGSLAVPVLDLAPRGDTCVVDWTPLILMLLDEESPAPARARAFHEALAQAMLQLARQTRTDTGVERVGFSGGVFQNRLLAERASTLLREDGFGVSWSSMIPVNDAGISCGQIVEFAHRQG
ncbi:MAG TPA: carbamoyltransferase HypF [Gammaproteobacteria bacterium]|nr:carbamoyltransferase HypF [Gammaproteobacteria bacterium]